MSGLRRMLAGKKGGFYVKGVDVTALKQGTETKYTYYVDITFSRGLSEDEGRISSVSAEVATGNSVMSEGGYAPLKKTGTFTPAGRVHGTTYRFPVFAFTMKFSYYRIKLTPMVGDTALEALPTLSGNIG